MRNSAKCENCKGYFKFPQSIEEEIEKRFCFSCRSLNSMVECFAAAVELQEFNGRLAKESFAAKLRSIKIF